MNPGLHRLLLGTLLGAAAAPAPAAGADGAPPTRCDAAGHREFDFWIGHWTVADAQGRLVGENLITAASDGCSLFESWRGRGGVQGNSINRWDPARRRWRQVWVDNQGGDLELSGGRVGGAMVLEGVDSHPAPATKPARQRITWTPLADGSVRQLWERSDDDGVSWAPVFDGRYVRRGAGEATRR